jgi:tetratricopeptide (TPR) repeat protein
MVDCTLFGLAPGPHHLVNVAFHVANTVLLFLVLESATGATWPSLVVAALFGLHPLHVQSVAWVSGRKDVLSAFFGILAIGAYVGWARRGGVGRYALTALLLALGLMAKPMLVTLPLVFLLLDLWPLERLRGGPRAIKRCALEKLPLLAVSAGSAVATVLVQRSQGAVMPVDYISPVHRVLNAVVCYARYLELTLWPQPLAVLYQHPYLPGGEGLAAWRIAAALVGLLALVALAAWSRRGWAIVGLLWFFGMLFPVSGLFQVGVQPMADRFTYLPLIGIFIAVAWAGRELVVVAPRLRPAVAGATAVALVAIASASWVEAQVWRDSITLWTHALRASPRSPIVRYNLGQALYAQGRFPEAAEHYREAIRSAPNDVQALNGLGVALSMQGRRAEAIALYEQALAYQSNYLPARNGLGIALQEEGRLDEAVAQYNELLRLNPSDAKGHNNLGYALELQRRLGDAEREYRTAITLDPAYVEALTNLARVLASQQRTDEAIEAYQRLLAVAPGVAGARNNLGLLLRAKSQFPAAIEQFQLALQIEPRAAVVINNLAVTHQLQGNVAEALPLYRRAIEVAPGYAAAHANLGLALVNLGQMQEAASHFERALELQPGLEAARVGLAHARAAVGQ